MQYPKKKPETVVLLLLLGLVVLAGIALAVLTAATVLFQRSYAERIDNYLMQICHCYAAAYEAQDTHSATTLLNLLPENCPSAGTSIDTDGTVLYDTKRGSYVVDVNGDIYAAQTNRAQTTPTARNFNRQWRTVPRASPARARRCSWRHTTTPCASTCRGGAQVLRVGEDGREHLGPEHRHPAAAVRRSRADFARCHAVQLVADPPHGAAHQPSGRASGHD